MPGFQTRSGNQHRDDFFNNEYAQAVAICAHFF